MTDWHYQKPAESPATRLDFAQLLASGVNVGARIYQRPIGSVGRSAGEWTLYVSRETFLLRPDDATPGAVVTALDVRAGNGEQVKPVVLPLPTANNATNSTVGLFARGWCVHIAADDLTASITYRAGSRTVDDSLSAWLAPGRPVLQVAQSRGVTSASDAAATTVRQRIPQFAVGCEVGQMYDAAAVAADPQVLWFAGPTIVGRSRLAINPIGSVPLSVPLNASHWAMVDATGIPTTWALNWQIYA